MSKFLMCEKMQLTITINFIYSKDNNEQRVIHSKSDNKETKINGEHKLEAVVLSLTMSIYCIANAIK